MFDRVGEIFSMVLGALAVGYLVFEIDRRRKLHEIFDVLDADDADITARLEDIVESGELQPYTGATLA
jgi:hypothetical protein